MAVELPEEVKIGIIPLEPGIPYHYAAWGIKYRFKDGSWRIANTAFARKSDAESWLMQYFLVQKGLEGETIPVERVLWLDNAGNIKSETKELIE